MFQAACDQPEGFVSNGDDDCDGAFDACGVCNGSGTSTWYLDADGDGLGDASMSFELCDPMEGFVQNGDDDCDGTFDACGICNGPGASTWYLDIDGDGQGDFMVSVESCDVVEGYVLNGDDDCDGTYDECEICNGSGASVWFVDIDSDGLGDAANSISSCDPLDGSVLNGDDNCDGVFDECGVCNGLGPSFWYADEDGDGLGDASSSEYSCQRPDGFVSNNDDEDDSTFLGVAEQQTTFNIYPIPANDFIVVEATGYKEPFSAYLYSVSGQLLIMENVCHDECRISLSALPTGLYFIELTGAGLSFTRKLVVE